MKCRRAEITGTRSNEQLNFISWWLILWHPSIKHPSFQSVIPNFEMAARLYIADVISNVIGDQQEFHTTVHVLRVLPVYATVTYGFMFLECTFSLTLHMICWSCQKCHNNNLAVSYNIFLCFLPISWIMCSVFHKMECCCLFKYFQLEMGSSRLVSYDCLCLLLPCLLTVLPLVLC